MDCKCYSKPITYALTLEELGTDVVHKYQGREPSGRMFNEIVLDHNSKFIFMYLIEKEKVFRYIDYDVCSLCAIFVIYLL